MSKTSKNTSLGVITGVFIFFLFLIGFKKFDEAYIQLKQSVVSEHKVKYKDLPPKLIYN